MSLYCYRCLDCEKSFEKFVPRKDYKKKQICSCGGDAIRDIVAEHSNGNVDGLMRENPRLSVALGCHPSQLKDMQKIHPGAEFVEVNGMCRMKIRNRQEKLRRMKERNFEEF